MTYFKDTDFLCQCGCGMDVTDEVKDMADRIRVSAGIPLVVNSGARCDAHNKAIGASETSSHTLGLAVDFRCTEGYARHRILKSMLKLDIKRIGLHKGFIHFDIDNDKPNSVWFY